MSSPFGVFILGLVSTCLHWEGAQCLEYNLTVPAEVRVQEGFCVIIPCNFTYPASVNPTDVELHVYWYTKGSNPSYDSPVATNDRKKLTDPSTHSRFRLSGDLEQRDCSLTINNARKTDQKAYFFRIEGGSTYLRYSYPAKPFVRVTDKPEIQILEKLRAGHPVNITCMTPGSCSSKVNITWGGVSANITSRIAREQSNEIEAYGTFIPSVADHGKNLTCIASYSQGTRSVQTEARVQLNVSYPPVLRFSGEHEHAGRWTNFTGVSHIEVQEGDSIRLLCEAESNPSAKATWVTKSKSSDHSLVLLDVKLKDKGAYKCHAWNTEGKTDAIFQVYVAYSPRLCEQDNSQCWKDDKGFRCNCSFCSHPPSKIQWQVNGKKLEGNSTDGNIQVTSWKDKEVATSILQLTGDLDVEQHFICLGTNPSGQIPLKFFVAGSGDSLKKNITSGIIGALAMFALVMLIVVIVSVVSKRCPKDRKPLTASESYAKPLTHVHSNLSPDVKHNSLTVPVPDEDNNVPEDPEKFEESLNEISDDPEELHYTSLNFGELKCLPEATLEESKSDYAEIKKF